MTKKGLFVCAVISLFPLYATRPSLCRLQRRNGAGGRACYFRKNHHDVGRLCLKMELSAPCEVSFVFERTNRELFSIINKMLMLIPSDSIITDMDTFIMKEQGYTKKNFFMEYFVHIFLSAIAFIVILVSLIFALRRIREDMYFDPLTHLRNRRSLNGFITKFLRRASEKGEVFCLILFDLDNFKYLNDTYGHDFGDEVLILYKGTLSEAKEVAERARKEIESIPMQHEYETVHFTATVGVAAYENGMSYLDLFRRVDANLYKGKNSGKNQVVG